MSAKIINHIATLTKQNLNKRSAELARTYSPSKAGKEIHQHLMDLLAFNIQPERNGDVSTLTKFLNAINHDGKAIVRVDAISTWIARYCPAEWSKSDKVYKGKPKKAVEFYGNDAGMAHMKQADSEPFYSMVKSSTEPKGFDFDKMLQGLLDRADKAMANEDNSFDPNKVKVDAAKYEAVKELLKAA